MVEISEKYISKYPSGEAVDAALDSGVSAEKEVQDARVSTSGTKYKTLKERLDSMSNGGEVIDLSGYAKKEELVGQKTTDGGEIFNDYGYNKASASGSHAEGQGTTASASCSHSEGTGTTASGLFSHSEGGGTTASGGSSHSEGGSTVASGNNSHAEGGSTVASGINSHSEGYKTIASSANQHVQGKFNAEDTEDKYAFIIGNGTSDTSRSNALTVDWDGNVVLGSDIFSTKTNGELVSLLETSELANNLSIYSKNLSTHIYVDAGSGNDGNDGLSSSNPLKTLDKAIRLAAYYRNAVIKLSTGYKYSATDKENSVGTGVHLYNCSVSLEAYGSFAESSPVEIQNSFFVYNGYFEMKNINLQGSGNSVTLFNSFCKFENSTMEKISPTNCVMTMKECKTPYILQYGGHSSLSGGKVDSIQVENGGFLNFTNCNVTGYASAPPSMICQNGVPVYMVQAKRIAEESTETITRYVDASSGSDSSPGTQSAPYRTLDAALHDVMYAKKAIIYLAAGTYVIPNKTVTWIHQDIRIYGNTKEDTVVKGNIIAESSFLRLSRVTVDSTDSETANVSTNTITAQYGTILRMDSCIVNTAYNMCVNCTETSKAYLTNCTFSGALQYAVHTTGFGDVRIYQCSDNSEKGVRSGGGSVVYITNSSSGTEFPYTNGNYGIVYVNGQQVLPQPTVLQQIGDIKTVLESIVEVSE